MSNFDYPKGTLETKFGTVHYALTEAGHVHLCTDLDPITVNRVKYSLGYHLYLIDGGWRARDRSDLFMSRVGSYQDPSAAARKAVHEVLPTEWTRFICDLPELQVMAQRKYIAREIESAEEKIVEMHKELHTKNNELKKLREQLAELDR